MTFPEKIEMHKRIFARVKEERNHDKIVKVGYTNVYIDEEEWRWNNAEENL